MRVMWVFLLLSLLLVILFACKAGLSQEEARAIAREEAESALASLPTPTPAPDIVATVTAMVATVAAAQPTPVIVAVGGDGRYPVVFSRPYGIYDIRSTIVKLSTPDVIGSGVLISGNSILTAYHVVRGFDEVNVLSEDIGEVKARVVGFDQTRDIALLEFDPGGKRLTVVEVRSAADAPLAGDPVVAIGFTIISNEAPILTFGRVSVLWNVRDKDFVQIQTDAAINDGMSGGGLFNDNGQLLGLIRAVGEELQGVGFAIDLDTLIQVLPDLRRGVKR